LGNELGWRPVAIGLSPATCRNRPGLRQGALSPMPLEIHPVLDPTLAGHPAAD